MKFFYHVGIFLGLHLLLWITVTFISESFHYPLYLYGLVILSAIVVLKGFEALFCLSFIGLWDDALAPFNRLFGWSVFVLVITMFSLKTMDWKNTFYYRPRFWCCLLNLLIGFEWSILMGVYYKDFVYSIRSYSFPIFISMFFTGWIAPYWIKLLKKYFI